MEVLRTYLKTLTTEEQEVFAASANTSIGYLRKAMSVSQLLAPALCVRIEHLSDGTVRRWDLRPDDWHLIWPELIGQRGAPRVKAAA